VRRLLGMAFLLGAFSLTACQQTQEDADEPADDTTVIERETTVEPAEDPDLEMDVDMEGRGGAAGEVDVEGN
jgi:hypothetical protein